jgi:hypothetical protein
MGPVSFERIGVGLDRPQLLLLAQRLRAAGIQPQVTSDDTVVLVRSTDAVAAAEIAASLASE